MAAPKHSDIFHHFKLDHYQDREDLPTGRRCRSRFCSDGGKSAREQRASRGRHVFGYRRRTIGNSHKKAQKPQKGFLYFYACLWLFPFIWVPRQ